MVERKTSDSGVADSNPVGGEILKRFLRLYTVCVFLTEVGITEKVNLLLVEVQNNWLYYIFVLLNSQHIKITYKEIMNCIFIK